MSDADRNVELLKDAYKKWGDSLGPVSTNG